MAGHPRTQTCEVSDVTLYNEESNISALRSQSSLESLHHPFLNLNSVRLDLVIVRTRGVQTASVSHVADQIGGLSYK